MLIDNNTISNIVNKVESNIHPDKVFLFGSYETVQANEDSDIDLGGDSFMSGKRYFRTQT